jgi:methionine synthase I (cobalamin-dependent)
MNFVARLASGTPLLLDGGMGSALIARGLVLGASPELWNLERPDEVTDIHRRFVQAGSDAIQTNTFGGNPIRLAAHGLEDRCETINRAAVEIARAARPTFVIGDVGPTGEVLPPVGTGDLGAWRGAFECQARALAEAGVDAFHVETMSDVREARVALEAIRAVAPGVPVMVSMTFDRKKRGFFTVMGDPLLDTLRSLAECGADAVGANCSIVSGDMRSLVEEASALAVPLVVQPNAGKPRACDDGSVEYAQTPDEFARDMTWMARRGANVLGGCCGTDERFIFALQQKLKEAA